MPIASGALGWPTSHFSKHEQDGDPESQNASAGNDVNTQIWRVQLADRDEYDRWKEEYDKMEKKLRKKKKKKRQKEREKREKDQTRDEASIVLQRYRRRRCLLLSASLLILFSCVFYGLVFLYTYYLDEDTLEPVVTFQNTQECGGVWRQHFLVFTNTLPNGTHLYYCCFMPDINATARAWVLSMGDSYPAGYMIRQSDCTPSGQSCQDFEKANTFPPGTPPCSPAPAGDVTGPPPLALLMTFAFVPVFVTKCLKLSQG